MHILSSQAARRPPPPLPAALRTELVEALARLLVVDLERQRGHEGREHEPEPAA